VQAAKEWKKAWEKKEKIGPEKISGRAGPLGRDGGKSRKDGFSPSAYILYISTCRRIANAFQKHVPILL
jgi:hypothetical protein